ncbi:DoxX-like protein [Kineococcus xinjiangensis]|uniref:DoxX-like protein n=1 Tax=Kineococcus xinjiangensis TaxID=512762 RepID=A0A2S6IUW8_9ACTN|nr:MauE/DoxX family redox-associated membrane protein [Kineococcus xinjiangensis]PPK98070.1 DoxX-like protein [Kineococcus xinjiangensis]
MHALLVPFLAGCLLLLGAGVAKLRRPQSTSQALRTQGLPSSVLLVRLLGAGEVVLAVAALAGLPAAAGLTALAYAAFTGFLLLALLRGRPLSSCGCFGEPDLPPTWAHAVLTAVAAVVCAAVAAGGAAGVPAVLALGPAAAVAVAASAALVWWLALQVLTALPRLVAARTPVPARAAPAAARAVPSRTPARTPSPTASGA